MTEELRTIVGKTTPDTVGAALIRFAREFRVHTLDLDKNKIQAETGRDRLNELIGAILRELTDEELDKAISTCLRT